LVAQGPAPDGFEARLGDCRDGDPSVRGPERFTAGTPRGLPLRWDARASRVCFPECPRPDGPFAWEFPGRLLLRRRPGTQLSAPTGLSHQGACGTGV